MRPAETKDGKLWCLLENIASVPPSPATLVYIFPQRGGCCQRFPYSAVLFCFFLLPPGALAVAPPLTSDPGRHTLVDLEAATIGLLGVQL